MIALDYERRPQKVKAFQFMGTPESANHVFDVFPGIQAKVEPNLYNLSQCEVRVTVDKGALTLAHAGDWIVQHENGQYEIMPPSKFERDYQVFRVMTATNL